MRLPMVPRHSREIGQTDLAKPADLLSWLEETVVSQRFGLRSPAGSRQGSSDVPRGPDGRTWAVTGEGWWRQPKRRSGGARHTSHTRLREPFACRLLRESTWP